MSEFELRRRLLALAQPREPAVDLFPAIAQRIARAPLPGTMPAPRKRWHVPEAIAALLVVGIGALLFVGGHDGTVALRHIAEQRDAPRVEDWSRREARALDASYGAAVAEVEQGAPVPLELRAAVTELDAAQAELEAALREDPDSTYLLKLLRQTHEQRLRLSTHAATRLG